MFGYIYLLQTRESYDKNEKIYKLGRTSKTGLTRFNEYPKGSLLYIHIYCCNPVNFEKELISCFNKNFINVSKYGKEYFEGDVHKMIELIQTGIINNYKNDHLEAYDKAVKEWNRKEVLLNEIINKQRIELNKQNNIKTLLEGQKQVSATAENNLRCMKCYKGFKSKKGLQGHEKICDGTHKLQCKVCMKMFTTQQGKWQHMKYVKCNPLSSQTVNNNTTINNINNNITNNNNNNITNNINIRLDFGKESLKLLFEDEDYLKNMEKHLELGKYAIPKSIEEIYFNDKFPENQTMKKERRNDKMVSIIQNGKWETRMFNDIYKDLIGKIERYHNKYFRDLQNQHEDTERNREFRQLMYPLRCFGHQMLWYGWTCNEIRKLGIDLNDADDDEERNRRRKEIAKIMLEKIYDRVQCE